MIAMDPLFFLHCYIVSLSFLDVFCGWLDLVFSFYDSCLVYGFTVAISFIFFEVI